MARKGQIQKTDISSPLPLHIMSTTTKRQSSTRKADSHRRHSSTSSAINRKKRMSRDQTVHSNPFFNHSDPLGCHLLLDYSGPVYIRKSRLQEEPPGQGPRLRSVSSNQSLAIKDPGIDFILTVDGASDRNSQGSTIVDSVNTEETLAEQPILEIRTEAFRPMLTPTTSLESIGSSDVFSRAPKSGLPRTGRLVISADGAEGSYSRKISAMLPAISYSPVPFKGSAEASKDKSSAPQAGIGQSNPANLSSSHSFTKVTFFNPFFSRTLGTSDPF
jgi:hypothetical protein